MKISQPRNSPWSCCGSLETERFCDDDGDYKRRYNVYKITADGKPFVLKKSDSKGAAIYRDFLRGRGFAVPEYLSSVEYGGGTWLLMKHIERPDLRHFTREMALACAETLAKIQRAEIEGDFEFRRARETVKVLLHE